MLCLAVPPLEKAFMIFFPQFSVQFLKFCLQKPYFPWETNPPMDSVYAETNTTFVFRE